MTDSRSSSAAAGHGPRDVEQLLSRTADGILVVDPEGVVLYANPAGAEILGRSPEAAQGFAFGHPVATSGGAELELIRSDGSLVIAELHTADIEWEGQPAVVVSLHDITARKEVEDLHRRLALLVGSTSDAMVGVDLDGVVESWNRAAEEIYGVPANEAVGERLGQLFAGAGEATVSRWLETVRTGEKVGPEVVTQRHRNGSELVVEVTVAHVAEEDGTIVGASVVGRDITRQHQSRLELERLHQLLREAERVARLGAWRWDLETDTLRLSEEWRRIHGVDDEVVSREQLFPVAHPDDRARIGAAMESVLSSGCRYEVEHRIVDQTSGEERTVRALGEVVETDAVGAPRTMVGVAWDVSEQRATEEQLRHAQKLQSVGRLAGGVAHDYNNILMAQMAACELMRHHLEEPTAIARYLDQVEGCGRRATALTRQLLAFSRRQAMRPEVVDLNQLVHSLAPMLRRLIPEHVAIELDLTDALDPVHVDPGQIEQVLVNLAVNARDAMPGGGQLRISSAMTDVESPAPGGPEGFLGLAPGRYVTVAVEDSGIGMDAEVRASVFEPFFTTKPSGSGTGLGLSTVYGIVKQSKGHIRVESEPGQGSVFTVYLPPTDGEIEADGDVPSPRNLVDETVSILVVEDDPSVREMLVEILRGEGHEVASAESGDDALRLLSADGFTPQLLITDVVMPGMTGKKLGDHCRSRFPELQVLYMSGYTDNAIVHHGVLDPDTPFLHKPFTISELVATVGSLLRRFE